MVMTLRNTKGSPLTYSEADANFSGLADGSLISALPILSNSDGTALGDALVAVKLNATGSVARNQHDVNATVVRLGDVDSLANFNTAVQGLTETLGIFGLAASENISTGAGLSILEVALSHGDAPVQIHISPASQNLGAGAGTYNHGLFIGHNVRRHSSVGPTATANTPSLIMGMENDYYDDGGDNKHASEWYIEYWSPDGTSVQFYRPYYARVFNGNNTSHGATIYQDIGTDGDGSWQVRAGEGNTVLFVTEDRFTIQGPVVHGGRLDGGYASFGLADFVYDATADRMSLGRLAALPSNSAGAYVGWANGIAGTSVGDLLLIPRSSNPSAIRFYSGSTAPVERWNISSSGNFLATTDNSLDIGASGATRPRTGYFGTSLITPLVTTAAVNSGAASGVAIGTSGGTGLNVAHVASIANFVSVEGSAANGTVKVYASGSDSDVALDLSSKGTDAVSIYTNTFSQVQFQILHTASATRRITVTGSNGGNPTLSTNAGNLNFGVAAIFPAGTTGVASINVPHGAAPSSPVNGDIWTTTAGLFVRVNGATIGPLS